jgi:hypothetical protein
MCSSHLLASIPLEKSARPGPDLVFPNLPRCPGPNKSPFGMGHSLDTHGKAVQLFADQNNAFLPSNPAQLSSHQIPVLLFCCLNAHSLAQAPPPGHQRQTSPVGCLTRAEIRGEYHLSRSLRQVQLIQRFQETMVGKEGPL